MDWQTVPCLWPRSGKRAITEPCVGSPNLTRVDVCLYVSTVEDGSVVAPCRVLDNTYRNAIYNWLSPEVLDGQSATERSDLYSYCVVIWEMLHGMLQNMLMLMLQIYLRAKSRKRLRHESRL